MQDPSEVHGHGGLLLWLRIGPNIPPEYHQLFIPLLSVGDLGHPKGSVGRYCSHSSSYRLPWMPMFCLCLKSCQNHLYPVLRKAEVMAVALLTATGGTVTGWQRGSTGRDSMRISPSPPMTAPGRTMSKEVGAGQDVAGVQSPNVDPWQIWDWKREIV